MYSFIEQVRTYHCITKSDHRFRKKKQKIINYPLQARNTGKQIEDYERSIKHPNLFLAKQKNILTSTSTTFTKSVWQFRFFTIDGRCL